MVRYHVECGWEGYSKFLGGEQVCGAQGRGGGDVGMVHRWVRDWGGMAATPWWRLGWGTGRGGVVVWRTAVADGWGGGEEQSLWPARRQVAGVGMG